MNGLRSLRSRTVEVTELRQSSTKIESIPLFIYLLVGSVVIIISICVIYFQIWQIEHIQSDIISMYAHIEID